jgi:broad specificity phosphatase PhoE
MQELNIDKQNLIIRHSIREEITDARDSQRQKLTTEGVALAQQLGKQLALYSDNFSLFHSPVLRCEQTAIEISKGILNNSKNIFSVEPMHILEGFYFTNWDHCSNLLNQQCLFEKWFAGEISAEHIIPIKDAANMMLDKIINKHNNLTNIFVTHDVNIICLLSLYSKAFKDIDYPDYLDGLIISNDKKYFEIIKHNQIIEGWE